MLFRSLVFLGETSVRRLPAKSDSIRFCSKIVAAFVGAYVYDWAIDWDLQVDGEYFISYGLAHVISPNRYAEKINYATAFRARELQRGGMVSELNRAETDPDGPDTRLFRVPSDVLDVIKCFFARDLASVEIAGCGYGDCLVWLGGEITGHDPFLFCNLSHDYSLMDDVDDDGAPLTWVDDEVRGHSLFLH